MYLFLLSVVMSSGVKLINKNKQFAALITGCCLVSFFLFTSAYAEKEVRASKAKNVTSTKKKVHQRNKTFMKRKWGVEVQYVRHSAAGYMLEFRYKVLDAKKAKLLFERQTKPILTHYKTGAKLTVPTPAKTGALRNSNPPKSGTTYWMFFGNPGKLVKKGDNVEINIGEFLVSNLVVK